jgi:hypothetical protein
LAPGWPSAASAGRGRPAVACPRGLCCKVVRGLGAVGTYPVPCDSASRRIQ